LPASENYRTADIYRAAAKPLQSTPKAAGGFGYIRALTPYSSVITRSGSAILGLFNRSGLEWTHKNPRSPWSCRGLAPTKPILAVLSRSGGAAATEEGPEFFNSMDMFKVSESLS
jgi:hypothetical protein